MQQHVKTVSTCVPDIDFCQCLDGRGPKKQQQKVMYQFLSMDWFGDGPRVDESENSACCIPRAHVVQRGGSRLIPVYVCQTEHQIASCPERENKTYGHGSTTRGRRGYAYI